MGEDLEGEYVLFTTMIILGTGSLIQYNLSKINLPYTVVIFVYGMLLGASSLSFPEWYDQFLEVYEHIQPRMLFHIFLPVLIFEGSYGIKPHALKNCFRHATILATLGLVINALIVAAAVKYFVYPEWNWFESLLLGSILSATDPVAVVTLLKDLGIDASVTAVIDAEALMNDGTAIICFEVLRETLATGQLLNDGKTYGDLAVDGLRLTVGAVALGYVSGIIANRVLRACEGDEAVTSVQTVCFAYIVFFLADVFFESSGVLALFTMGTYLARNYPSQFPGSHHSHVTGMWHFLVQVLNTIIFCLVGILIARKTLQDFNFAVLGTMLFMYCVCVIGRALMIVVLLPLMNFKASWKLTWREVALQVYGGLRGGVATILVLIVLHDLERVPGGAAKGAGFLNITCGVVIITIVANATTSGWVVRKLDLQAKPRHRLHQMTIGQQHVNHVLQHAVAEAKKNFLYQTANWAVVSELAKGIDDPYSDTTGIQEEATLSFICILMRVFKTEVFFQRDEKKCTEEVCATLVAIAQKHIQRSSLTSVNEFVDFMDYPAWLKWLEKKDLGCLRWLVSRQKTKHDSWFFGLLLTYGEGLKAIEKIVPEYAETSNQVQIAMNWLNRERQEMSHFISVFQEERPLATVSVFTKIAAASVMREATEAVDKLHHERGFSQFDTNALHGAVGAAAKALKSLSNTIEPATPESVFALSPIGQGLSEVTISVLARSWSVKHAAPDTEIDVGYDIAVLVKGIATLISTYDAPLTPGSTWGAEVYITGGKAPAVITSTEVTYITLSPPTVQQWMKDDVNFSENMISTGARAIGEDLLAQMARFSLSEEKVQEAISRAKLFTAPSDNWVPPASDNDDVITMFIKGADKSGMLTPATLPLVIPSVNFKWQKDTILLRVEAGFFKHMQKETTHRLMRMPEGFELAGDDAVEMDFVPASPLSKQDTQHSIIEFQSSFAPSECATCIPYFNRFQLRFIVALEQLKRASSHYERAPTHNSRRQLLHAKDFTLQFLSRFCVNMFGKEAVLYRLAKASCWPAQKNAHEKFQASVSLWLERRAVDDRLFYNEIQEGMINFATEHFVQDAKDVKGFLVPFFGYDALGQVSHASDFKVFQNGLRESGDGMAPSASVSQFMRNETQYDYGK